MREEVRAGSGVITDRNDVDDVMDRMRWDQVRRIQVVEDGDCLVGIIAQADIAAKRPQSMDNALTSLDVAIAKVPDLTRRMDAHGHQRKVSNRT